MPINYINTGSSPNKGDGDTLRTAFSKINANFATLVQEIGSTSSYVLPTATTSTLGGIKVGANLTINDGVLSATAVPATPFTGTVAILTATESINLGGIVLSNNSGTLSAITITGTATEEYVELLLHADDFTEDSTNNVPILSNGVTVNTSVKKFGVGSFYFDGGSYISLPGSASNPAFDQAGDITIEFWAYVDTFNVGNIICSEGLSGSHWAIENAGGKLYFQCNDGVISSEIIPGTNLPVAQWTHCAVVKSGTDVTIYQNGGAIGSVNIGSSTAFNDTIYDIAIGSISDGSFGYFQGYLDEIRISRGVALYTGTFTPPTAPFPGDSIVISNAIPQVDFTNIGSNILPSADLTYNLGSPTRQWRSLYVGTSTIYIGGVPLTINTANNTLIVGTSTNATIIATEDYVDQAVADSQRLEIDGGNAFTDYTAEILIDGGGA